MNWRLTTLLLVLTLGFAGIGFGEMGAVTSAEPELRITTEQCVPVRPAPRTRPATAPRPLPRWGFTIANHSLPADTPLPPLPHLGDPHSPRGPPVG